MTPRFILLNNMDLFLIILLQKKKIISKFADADRIADHASQGSLYRTDLTVWG